MKSLSLFNSVVSPPPGNSTLFFHLWKFHFVFNYPLEIQHAIFLIPLEIPYPTQPSPVCFFSGIAQFSKMIYLFVKKSGIMNYPYANDAFPLLNTQQKQITFINFSFILVFMELVFVSVMERWKHQTVFYLVI